MAAVQYARIVGIVVLVLGIVGLFVSTEILGLLTSAILEDFVHLVVGGLLVVVGFSRGRSRVVGPVVLVVGVVLLLTAIVGFIDNALLGLLAPPWTVVDNVIHLVLGIAGIVVG